MPTWTASAAGFKPSACLACAMPDSMASMPKPATFSPTNTTPSIATAAAWNVFGRMRAGVALVSVAPTERHFGLGRHGEVDVRVEFYPSGKIVKREVKANSTILISETE